VELAAGACQPQPSGLTMAASRPSEAEKTRITATCQRFIDEILKPRFLPAITTTEFNYCVDIQGKWQGPRCRFIQRYRSGFPENLGEECDAPFVRIDWTSPNLFDIQWHRHNGTWYRLYRGQTLVQALKTIEADGHLHPL
jgi:hypothetical protein